MNSIRNDNDERTTSSLSTSAVVPVDALKFHTRSIKPPTKIPRLLLLDRDGVINVDVGAPGVIDKKQLRLIRNVGISIGNFRRIHNNHESDCCYVALITNQSCVGKGIITLNELNEINDLLQQMLVEEDGDATFDKLYVCTSTKDDNDYRMKPNPGMILEAISDFNNSKQKKGDDDFDVNTINDYENKHDDIVFIGDTITDMMAAKASGINLRILTETGYGKNIMKGFYTGDKNSDDDISSLLPKIRG